MRPANGGDDDRQPGRPKYLGGYCESGHHDAKGKWVVTKRTTSKVGPCPCDACLSNPV